MKIKFIKQYGSISKWTKYSDLYLQIINYRWYWHSETSGGIESKNWNKNIRKSNWNNNDN